MRQRLICAAALVSAMMMGVSFPLKGQETSPPPFELIDWYLGLPVDEDGDGKADSISEQKLANGWSDPRFFFPSDDGGLTFRAPVYGAKTSANTNYVRTELREMLRRGNSKIKTAEPGKEKQRTECPKFP